MKRKLLSISFLMLASTVIFAQGNSYVPPVYEQGKNFFYSENFEYEPGGMIPEKSGNKWFLKDKGTTPKIIADNLIHSHFDESFNKGNALELITANLRGLASTLFMEPTQMINGQLYVSFLLKVSQAYAVNQDIEGTPDFVEGGEKLDPFMQFNRIEDSSLGLKSGGNGQLFAKALSPDKYKLGITRFGLNKNTPNAVYADQELLYGSTYHVIIKVNYTTSEKNDTDMERNENIYLFIDPYLGGEPINASAKQESVLVNKTASAISGIHFLQNPLSPSAVIDGLRIANTWDGLGVTNPNSAEKINSDATIKYAQRGRVLFLSNLKNASSLSLFDLSGRLVLYKNNISENEELSGVNSGIYILKNGKSLLKIQVK